MKIHFTIELTQEDLLAALRENNFNGLKSKQDEITQEVEEIIQQVPEKKSKNHRMILTHIKKCKICGKEFKPKSNRQVYCSDDCGMHHKIYIKKKIKNISNLLSKSRILKRRKQLNKHQIT